MSGITKEERMRRAKDTDAAKIKAATLATVRENLDRARTLITERTAAKSHILYRENLRGIALALVTPNYFDDHEFLTAAKLVEPPQIVSSQLYQMAAQLGTLRSLARYALDKLNEEG